ncbi:MAG TPA: ABC transporter ATP-binding protein [Candidatus Melainabacteria bacterium]|nr:ABC transporter ATP-binding protein [Candidatus Melainabacteria bacterium]HMP51274.1 ABC transporter ATP-binding protein [Candidatus Melainabacteria bacterium]
MRLIELNKVMRTYELGGQPVHALKEVDLTIGDGEFVAIMGASGSGKSTLMNIIGCLDKPSSGTYSLEGVELQYYSDDELAEVRNRKIGFVFQQFNLLPRMTALENVMLPLIYGGIEREVRSERAERYLKLVGLGDRVQHRPSELSGGQQQRVSIARALVNQPQILLADEPTGALDSSTSAEIMNLLDEMYRDGLTVILVTHDQEVASYAKRVIRLKDGSVVSPEMPR